MVVVTDRSQTALQPHFYCEYIGVIDARYEPMIFEVIVM